MASSRNSSAPVDNAHLVEVETRTLQEQLNHLYAAMRECAQGSPTPGLFEYLWDLKELAILEGKNSVEVPNSWLEELDHECAGVDLP